MPKLSEVQKHVGKAADAIAGLPSLQWAGWVVYLLRALQEKDIVTSDFYSEMLADVGESIDRRLKCGRW